MNAQLVEWLSGIDAGKAVPRSTLEQVIRELRAELAERDPEPAAEDPKAITCPKCKRPLRVKVEMFLDIPVAKWGQLSKEALRSKDVVSDGVNWPRAAFYCTQGHCYMHPDK
jgi:hypothetical protein